MAYWQDKRVLITGASSGIGLALAEYLVDQKAKVALLARRKDLLEATALSMAKKGGEVMVLSADVKEAHDLEGAVSQIEKSWGGLDVVVANAGFGVVGNFEQLKTEDYRRQFDVNVFGALQTVKACLPLIKKSRGRIAVVGSALGFFSLAGNSPYSMSKFAVRSFCLSLRLEMHPLGVGVIHIAPGLIATNFRKVDNHGVFHPEAKEAPPKFLAMKPAKAARIIARAIEKNQRECVVTFHGKFLTWLGRFFPGLLARLLLLFRLESRGEVAKAASKY